MATQILSTHKIQQVIWLFVVLLLGGCGMMPQNGQVSFVNNTPSPQAVAQQFLAAWNNEDLEAMYNLISVRSQALYEQEAFNRFYQTLDTAIGLTGVAFTLEAPQLQGTSAAIDYTIEISSDLFGSIPDEGRTLRLVQDGEQWRVAWSPMDIFEGYTSDAALSTETVQQARANIYDRNGEPLVLQNGEVSVLFARQNLMPDTYDCAWLLADLTYTPLPQMLRTFSSYLPETAFYVGEVDRYIETEYADQLASRCGITADANLILQRRTRQYIGQGAAVHVTGYIGPIPQEPEAEKNRWLARGYSESDLIGRAGIELEFEQQLAGRSPRVLRVTEAGGTVLKELGRIEGTPPQPVYLTIDRELQLETARAVAWGYNYASNNWAAEGISPGGGAIVMDVNTGAILAMASFPTFQPGLFNPDSLAPNRGQILSNVVNSARNPLSNRVTQEQFSPGSIFKIVTTAAIINENLINPDEIFFCDLRWDGRTLYGDTFSPRSDWRLTDGLEATGDIVSSQALTSSCDPYYYEFGARLFLEVSPSAVVDYAHMMGYDGETGLGIYREAPGNIPVPRSVEEAINNAIGQGDTQVTVLQSAMMVSAVANGGTLYEPYIVQQIGEGDSAQIVGQPTVVRELALSELALEVARQGMCDVVSDPIKGTAYWVFNDYVAPYSACGKTGTAQAGYAPNAWFVAYAPADNPQIAVVAMAQNSREGSEVAAPMVRRILDGYFGVEEPAPFPAWWQEEYVPLNVPEGGVAGG